MCIGVYTLYVYPTILQNVANLYRIEIDKGVDDAYIVDITATDASYWNLFGYANQGHGGTSTQSGQ